MFDGNKVIFIAPPADMVPQLMDDLFYWLKADKDVPMLIKSCIFHYEFVFIHPFSDGNGRTVRLWQNVLLTKWNPIFEYIPIESKIQKYQKEYYKSDKGKESLKKAQNKYQNQLCSYNGEILTLGTLSTRFRKAGIEHPTIEAKKYLVL